MLKNPLASLALFGVIIFGSIAAAFWLISSATNSQTAVEQHSAKQAQTYADSARITIEGRCRRLAAAEQLPCMEEANETARNAQHDERDLETQKATAIWTQYMAYAAIGGTAFGIIGIALVLGTFVQNKRSADAAHEANRPWIEIEMTETDIQFEEGGGVRFIGKCNLINRGNSPATKVMPYAQLVASHGQRESSTEALDRAVKVIERWNREEGHFGATVFPSQPRPESLMAVITPQEHLAAIDAGNPLPMYLLAVIVRYRVGAGMGETAATFMVKRPSKSLESILSAREPGFTLVDTYRGYAK